MNINCNSFEEYKVVESFLFGLTFNSQPNITNFSLTYPENRAEYKFIYDNFLGKWIIDITYST